ncbi:T9SS type B sorting domain-containing protein [bacterium]|nr:T9SS type B sorting domain-containing protein [bacterium]
MHQKQLLFIYFLFSSITLSFAQLSTKHYIPPITTSDPIANQIIYISTPSLTNINFTITPIGGSPINYVASNDSPFAYEIFNSSNGGNNSQLHQLNSDTNTIIDDKGFIIESTEGLLSVSVRVRRALITGFGQVHAGALVSKGLSALGREFRVGGLIPEVSGGNRLNFVSVMATENNTNITFNIPSGTDLLNSPTTTGPVSINLNENETYIMAVGGTSENREKLIGILVSSDKDIVVNSGSANSSFGNIDSNSDYGFDQIVGADKIDNEYIFVRAEGEDIIENILVIAHEDNTDVFINDAASPEINLANAGDWVVIEGDGINNNGNGYNTNGNMYLQTSKPVFAYQGIGGLDDTGFPSQANQGMFFVPPLSCENSGNVDNIPNINRMQPGTNSSDNFTGGITIVTNTVAVIEVFQNNIPITINPSNGPFTVTGNPDYVTYRFDNLIGNIKATSNQELYCAYFNYNGFAASGGFYSGFPSPPEINLGVDIGAIGFCIPGLKLESVNTSFFDSVEWFYDDGNGAGFVTTGNTTGTLVPSFPGNYVLKGTLACSGRTFDSQIIRVSACPDNLDNDLIIDNLDIDLDNDGILNCDESKGDTSINFTSINSPVLSFQDGTTDASFISATTSSSDITGDSNSNFESTIIAGTVPENVYTLDFNKPSNVKLTQNPTSTHTTITGETFILSVGPSTKNITVIDPDNILLIDTDFDDIFETDINNFSGSYIVFKYNPTPSGTTPYKLVANNVDQITFKHQLNGTVNSTFNGNLILTCFGIDSDNDGIVDAFDADSDNDGIPDIIEAQGIPVTLLGTDADLDGLDDVFTTFVTPVDSDLDNVPDYLDLDSDNDGVYDLWEAGHPLLDVTLTDGQIDDVDLNIGINGLDNRLETAPDNFILNYTISDPDTDDSFFSYLDLDSDGDNCPDVIEAGFTDPDNDNIIGPLPVVVDDKGRVIGILDGYTRPNPDYNIFAPILINTPFVDIAFCETSTSTISIDSTADTFQWEVSTNGGTNWTSIIDDTTYNGATTKDLEISNLQLSLGNNQYRVFLQRTGNTCNDTSNEITLTVEPLPSITFTVELKQCDDDTDGFSFFNLNEAASDISTNYLNETFVFYPRLLDADNGTNAYTPAEALAFRNRTVTTDTVWARAISGFGCYRIAEVNLVVSTTGLPTTFQRSFTLCDDFLDIDGIDTINNDDTDGVTAFNFSSVTAEVRALFPASQQLTITYYRNQANALAEVDAITDTANYRNIGYPNTQQIYIRVDSDLDNDCLGFGPFITLTVDPVPTADPVTNLILCDNGDDGDFFNGIVQTFNLESQTPIIRGTQDPLNFTVTYHTSDTDALSGANQIINTSMYENIIPNLETIYVRVANNTTGCFTNHTSFDLIVNELPIANFVDDLEVCDDNTDGSAQNGFSQSFDLNLQTDGILGTQDPTQFSVTYHASLTNAQAGILPLGSPFSNSVPFSQIIYARVYNSLTGCANGISNFNAIVNPEPTTENVSNLSFCDDDLDGDDTNGFVQNIDLDSQITAILGPVQDPDDFTVTFHETQADASAGTDALSSPYTNTTADQQTIFVRVLNDDTLCVNDDFTFEVIINPLPKFKVTSPQIVCLSGPPLTLFVENPAAVYDYVWTAPNGNESFGSQITIESGGLYTVTATTTNGTLCTRTREIQVNESIVATITDADVTIVDDSDNNSISIDPTNLGIGDYQYALINEDGNQTSFQDIPLFENLAGGFYTIVVEDKNGCRPNATLEVSVIEYPKFFTPNNDGVNDTWAIKGANSTFYPNAQINIFNRFGKVVAQIEVDTPGWTGTYGGKTLPSDDYWFSIILVDRNGRTRNRKGNFSLLRR